VCANGRHELRKHVWTEHGRHCDNEKEKTGLSGEVRGSNAQCGAGAPISLSSPMARHAQEERPLRICHDSSNSAGRMCGGGFLAQAPAGYIAAARRKMAMAPQGSATEDTWRRRGYMGTVRREMGCFGSGCRKRWEKKNGVLPQSFKRRFGANPRKD
jgi:hypothetical protein